MLTPDQRRYMALCRGDPGRRKCRIGGRQRAAVGVDPVIELRLVGGDQYQALTRIAALDAQQSQHGVLVVRHAAEAEHAFGRVSDHAATE